ncbi:MAG: hypothetical protein ACYTCN_06940 [Planctomycetota bacterium]|jgi:hypothetical protein
MEVCAIGYFKKVDKFKRIVLVNLEEESKTKLKNCERNLRVGESESHCKSPLLPNGLLLKHDLRSLVYDVDKVPASTLQLIGQKVSVRAKVKKYRFKKSGEVIVGWSLKLIEMRAV